MSAVVKDVHIEPAGAFGHEFADAACADESQCSVMNFSAAEEHGLPAGKFACTQIALCFADTASGSEKQAESETEAPAGRERAKAESVDIADLERQAQQRLAGHADLAHQAKKLAIGAH